MEPILNSSLPSYFNPIFASLEHKERIEKQAALKTLFEAVHLASALDIYKINRAIIHITRLIAEKFKDLTNEWAYFLKQIDGRSYTVKDSYPIRLNTSVATYVLNHQVPWVICGVLDLKNLRRRQQFIEFLIEMDSYSFRDNLSFEFLNKMLEPKEARAFIACHNNHIIGGLWGFFTEYEDKKIFHIWLLVIRPEFSSLGVGKNLIELAKEQNTIYCNVTLMTLNVDHKNKHAKMFYDKENFLSFSDQIDKNFMGCYLVTSEDQIMSLSADTTKNIVKEYVLINGSYFQLAYWEATRQSTLFISRWFWWYNNPNYKILELSDDL